MIDQVNGVSQFTYDSSGNMTEETYPDGNNIQYTYNSFSEPLTYINADGNTYHYTYDGDGNLTVIKDPLSNLTTMTYTANGPVYRPSRTRITMSPPISTTTRTA